MEYDIVKVKISLKYSQQNHNCLHNLYIIMYKYSIKGLK